MNIDFFEQKDVPQPRTNIKIERLEARPYPDGWRIKLMIDVTPFQERPSLELRVRTAAGREVAELSVIETMHRSMEFTVHVRGVPSPLGDYVLEADLYYEERTAPQDQQATPFSIETPPAATNPATLLAPAAADTENAGAETAESPDTSAPNQ